METHSTPSDPNTVLIYSLRQAVTSHGVFSIFKRIPFRNRDIEKRVAFSGLSICRQVSKMIPKVRDPGTAAARHFMLNLVFLSLLPTIRLTLLGSDFPWS
ncbi:hypothetical protein AVEN_200465-1 [Araneus ventricosus]|uniref:Uncharacterized protein n=1 Tax=Araneus ventricosus TaxID=182803 RepID=A0A4Y2LV60_ARAVE|nr:hypothetical protein AVEN_200465-1 [Araneus ventricosus]